MSEQQENFSKKPIEIPVVPDGITQEILRDFGHEKPNLKFLQTAFTRFKKENPNLHMLMEEICLNDPTLGEVNFWGILGFYHCLSLAAEKKNVSLPTVQLKTIIKYNEHQREQARDAFLKLDLDTAKIYIKSQVKKIENLEMENHGLYLFVDKLYPQPLREPFDTDIHNFAIILDLLELEKKAESN